MRPVFGFKKQKSYFVQAIRDKKLVHAYLFSGTAMIGKKQFALNLCHLISPSEMSIEQDQELKYIAPRAISDEMEKFITYSEAKNSRSGQEIYVEDIQNVRAFLTTKPLNGPYKMVVIDNADCMNDEASNALLKILEEPSASTVFILISARPQALLPTVISRCQNITFLPHPLKETEQALSPYKILRDDKKLILLLAQGRIGWALDILDNKRLDEIKKFINEFQTVLRKGSFERMEYAKKVSEYHNPSYVIDIWIRWIRTHGKDAKKTHATLSELIWLYSLVSQPQFNRRLALENFLINI